MQPVAPALGVELSVVNIRETDALESGISKAAGFQNAALLITSSAPGSVHRHLIIRLAARRRLPAIYPYAFYVAAGGLFCYGPIPSISIGVPPAMSIAFSRARNHLIE